MTSMPLPGGLATTMRTVVAGHGCASGSERERKYEEREQTVHRVTVPIANLI
jgi:hypothetical protein